MGGPLTGGENSVLEWWEGELVGTVAGRTDEWSPVRFFIPTMGDRGVV